MARLLIVLALLALVAGSAHATYLFNWTVGDPHVVRIPDPDTDGHGTGSDIFDAIWWGQDLDYTYLRMDLEATPTNPNSGDIYGFYFDTDNNPLTGAQSAAGDVIPTELVGAGVDYRVTVDWSQSSGRFANPNLQQWNNVTNSWDDVLTPTFQSSINNGTTVVNPGYDLEWRFALGSMPSNFTFWGAVLNVGSGDPDTWDIAGPGVTPEPTTMALLGLGLGGLYLKRRRRA